MNSTGIIIESQLLTPTGKGPIGKEEYKSIDFLTTITFE